MKMGSWADFKVSLFHKMNQIQDILIDNNIQNTAEICQLIR